MKTFRVKNFEKFQHYKDRNPPWIRFYNTTLDDYDFGQLPDASKFHLAAIWLLASRSANKLPYDSAWVSRRINATEMVDLDRLAQAGFIIVDQEVQSSEQDASTTLAKCSPEQSRAETEQKEEKKNPSGRDAPQEVSRVSNPPDTDDDVSEKAVFGFGKTVLGKSSGGVIVKLVKQQGGDLRKVKQSLQQAMTKENPMEYVQAILRQPAQDDWRRGAI